MSGSLIASFLGGLTLLIYYRRFQLSRPSSPSKSVAIIVLGDFTRSPRIIYHTESCLRNDYQTHIVAYKTQNYNPSTEEAEHLLHRHSLSNPPNFIASTLPFILLAPIKVVWGTCSLLYVLTWKIRYSPGYFIVQNPPSIPTLPIVQFVAWLRGSRIIIDWHNTGYSVLRMRFPPAKLGTGGEGGDGKEREVNDHVIVKIAKSIETYFGRSAHAHLTVTNAMNRVLSKEIGLRGRIETFHDRPPRHFRKQTIQESYELFQRIPCLSKITFPPSTSPSSSSSPSTTTTTSLSPAQFFTSSSSSSSSNDNNRTIVWNPDRPALLITSTSHTPDEDLGLLVDALSRYEIACRTNNEGERNLNSGQEEVKERFKRNRLPRIIMLVTGKGSGKRSFEKLIEQREEVEGWRWVRIRTEWLELEDYPKLLGSSDLGISLHSSTSGIDLPMKVVDMFGCQLPVLALKFPCISELVVDGKNGRTFTNDIELCDQMVSLLRGFPFSLPTQFPSELETLRAGIKDARYGGMPRAAGSSEDEDEEELREGGRGETDRWNDWEENWDRVVLPLISP